VTALPDGARVCARTGLVLVPAKGETGWRLSKTSYGPLNPPARPADPEADPAGGEGSTSAVDERPTPATPTCSPGAPTDTGCEH
jgi:hypothetical protein